MLLQSKEGMLSLPHSESHESADLLHTSYAPKQVKCTNADALYNTGDA